MTQIDCTMVVFKLCCQGNVFINSITFYFEVNIEIVNNKFSDAPNVDRQSRALPIFWDILSFFMIWMFTILHLL